MSILNKLMKFLKNIQQINEQKKNKPIKKQIIDIQDVKNFTNYVKKVTKKNKIVIHGTYGGTGEGAISWMNSGTNKNVATHFVINQNGKIFRLFDQKYFAYHAGGSFRQLSKNSFGIQIVNWLSLDKNRDGQYVTWTGRIIPEQQVKIVKTWRGKKYFHKITPKQHQSLQKLLKYLCQKYNITKKFYRHHDPTLPVNDKNFSGILQHSTFHKTKMDFEKSIVPIIRI